MILREGRPAESPAIGYDSSAFWRVKRGVNLLGRDRHLGETYRYGIIDGIGTGSDRGNTALPNGLAGK
jgi:hypothetical protein